MFTILRSITVFIVGFTMGWFLSGNPTIEGWVSSQWHSMIETVKEKHWPIENEKKSVSVTESTKKVSSNTTPVSAVKEVAQEVSPHRLFTVQIASFVNVLEAKSFLERVHNRQIDAYISKDASSNQPKFSICVGEYMDKQDAHRKQDILAKDYVGAFVRPL